VYNDNAHKMDIYTPDVDNETNRPLILYMHGGSFYAGDKGSDDCVDFCESMAKKGYVTASLNYRLASNIVAFLTSNENQYETVLKAVSDAKAATRYFRKSLTNGNPYGIDGNSIFTGGYSAGGVIAIHHAFIDNINDLPNTAIDNDGSSFNVQSIINNFSASYGLEGDAGNYGYSSKISGVISFAGGINDVSWIDINDEPLVSIQGTDDLTVAYNCGPGLNNSLVLTLCGSAEMHTKADLVGVVNDKLIFNSEGHTWAANGNSNNKFIQAIDFTSDFLFPLLPCNNTTDISESYKDKKQLINILDPLGRKSTRTPNKTLFYVYSDGSVEHKIVIE
jgi:hypothetical protein